ncbi:MAG: hypothetical protein V3T78_08040, partial [Dehalococcoidia bacterium]
ISFIFSDADELMGFLRCQVVREAAAEATRDVRSSNSQAGGGLRLPGTTGTQLGVRFPPSQATHRALS